VKYSRRAVQKGGRRKRYLFLIPIVLLALAIIILPYVDLKGVKQRIAEEASSQLKGEVLISRAALSLLPWPHVTLRGVQIRSMRWGQCISQEVRIYPRLLPLLKKKIRVKSLFVKDPVLDLVLREGAIERKRDIFSQVEQEGARVAPSLTLEGGVVNILRPEEKEPFFTIQGLTGRVTPRKEGEVRLTLHFSCPGAERIELRVVAWVSLVPFSPQGRG